MFLRACGLGQARLTANKQNQSVLPPGQTQAQKQHKIQPFGAPWALTRCARNTRAAVRDLPDRPSPFTLRPVNASRSSPPARGAGSNPPNRFEQLTLERDADWDPEQDPLPRTQFFRDRSSSIISYNDSPDIDRSQAVLNQGISAPGDVSLGAAGCIGCGVHLIEVASSACIHEGGRLSNRLVAWLAPREFKQTLPVPSSVVR